MTLLAQACAKVNLTLEALGKRDDGYHDIVSVLQSISLADTISFESGETLEYTCDVPDLQTSDNLILRAAHSLREATGCGKGAKIHLIKRIPVAAGLGSGATDAATTLIALDRLWGTNVPFPRLLELAAGLGSDVSFFLHGGTALAEGRGEAVTPLLSVPEMWLVLLIPPIEIADKTAQLYAQLRDDIFTSGHKTSKLVENINKGTRPD
ncbi:MAG: 4-(cytidine 5'-diphospho)-2-C-methyl-D-erythritol kinase, partial [Dehalococcoidia bacterium]